MPKGHVMTIFKHGVAAEKNFWTSDEGETHSFDPAKYYDAMDVIDCILLNDHAERASDLGKLRNRRTEDSDWDDILRHLIRYNEDIPERDLFEWYALVEQEVQDSQNDQILWWWERLRSLVIQSLPLLWRWDRNDGQKLDLSSIEDYQARFSRAMSSDLALWEKNQWKLMLDLLEVLADLRDAGSGFKKLHTWCLEEFGELLSK
jgi:hypothetical protein